MSLMKVTDNDQETNFIKSGAGPELTTFWEKEARIRWQAVGADAKHTDAQILEESRKAILTYVSRDRAIIDLLHIPQGDRSINEFVAQVEDQASLCRVAQEPITEDDLKRIVLISGFKDRLLAEKCLGEQYDLT